MNRLATLLTAAALLVLGLLAPPVVAHQVPDEVTVFAFLKPEGDRLTFLVRAPLESLRDVDIPTKANGALDLTRIDDPLRYAAQIWISDFVEVYENGERLPKPEFIAARVALPGSRGFESFDTALAGITGERLDPATDITWEQGYIEVAYAYPITSEDARFSIRPALTRLGVQVNVILQMLFPDGEVRVFNVHADVGRVELDPSWWQAFALFSEEGFWHILGGIDHLLFLFALVIPFRRLGPLAVVVTAFTVAHSITLIAAAYGLAPDTLWFAPLIETLIAVSILYMALENIVGANVQRRWWIAFGFGLVHGFGFSFLLTERLQFAGSHLLTSLLAFNLGVEIGQLLMLALAVPALGFVFRRVMPERIGVIILSALVAHIAWHWMTERGSELMQFPFPMVDAFALSRLLWWLIAAVGVAGLLWLVSSTVRRFQSDRPDPGSLPPAG